jgi:crotonobetaine/carnitine-CoA ligase
MGRPDGWVEQPQRTVLELLQHRVAADPDGPFLTVCGTPYTARQVDVEANRLANGLIALGVEPGDRVATLLDNSSEAVVAFYGALKAGAVYVPVNNAHKGVFLEHHLADADPVVFVVHEDYADRVTEELLALPGLKHLVAVGAPGAIGSWSSWLDLVDASDAAPDIEVRPSDIATLIYTGGTTGPSKGCALSHNYVVYMCESLVTTWGRNATDVVWTPLPLFHFNALGIVLVGTLIAGGSAVIVPRFSVSRFWDDVNAAGATIASLLGSLAVMIARDENRSGQPRSGAAEANTTVRLVTGAPMPPEIDDIYRDRFGITTFSNAYGTTEVSLVSWLPRGTPPRSGSAGVVNAEAFDVRIFGDDDQEVPIGADGEIVVRPRKANVMFSGYWRRPEATARDSTNLWWHTGDIGRIDEDGYLYFVDRKADYIRRRGENISTWELEQTFHRHDLVADVAVTGVPSPVGEDDVKVTLVLQPGAEVTEEAICLWSMERLPYFAVPRYVEFRTELPKNPTGRITKAPLREDGITAATWDRDAAGIVVKR